MADRGYPVDQPIPPADTVDEYQRAHRTAERVRNGAATTEELSDAMARYRALFAEILGHVSHGEQGLGKHAASDVDDTIAYPTADSLSRHRRW